MDVVHCLQGLNSSGELLIKEVGTTQENTLSSMETSTPSVPPAVAPTGTGMEGSPAGASEEPKRVKFLTRRERREVARTQKVQELCGTGDESAAVAEIVAGVRPLGEFRLTRQTADTLSDSTQKYRCDWSVVGVPKEFAFSSHQIPDPEDYLLVSKAHAELQISCLHSKLDVMKNDYMRLWSRLKAVADGIHAIDPRELRDILSQFPPPPPEKSGKRYLGSGASGAFMKNIAQLASSAAAKGGPPSSADGEMRAGSGGAFKRQPPMPPQPPPFPPRRGPSHASPSGGVLQPQPPPDPPSAYDPRGGGPMAAQPAPSFHRDRGTHTHGNRERERESSPVRPAAYAHAAAASDRFPPSRSPLDPSPEGSASFHQPHPHRQTHHTNPPPAAHYPHPPPAPAYPNVATPYQPQSSQPVQHSKDLLYPVSAASAGQSFSASVPTASTGTAAGPGRGSFSSAGAGPGPLPGVMSAAGERERETPAERHGGWRLDMRVRSVCTHFPQEPNEIFFREGDLLHISWEDPSGWVYGQVLAREGIPVPGETEALLVLLTGWMPKTKIHSLTDRSF
uniref:SH3 domain-containing protein n=1 Tax=Chromera velia CCMP2878 TaxID=1169474 RepID=A0A0G4GBC9_9ALVE|eukprot:Cvel_4472.t1-p1 / transcript=Cvel_4472.t1 / gene=Cvel_4472 / organism=Chromera_velia_CCMP2878 / gene_product=hypothetical protein / transcript_product=hypothetical protein / location=Cvel_scaffold195:97413-100404(-) / protein_length=563 / sequence_SO=supercontig / SO=protein_coding / is_pseudo=false